MFMFWGIAVACKERQTMGDGDQGVEWKKEMIFPVQFPVRHALPVADHLGEIEV
jgi:hypothetical protein